MEDLILRSLQGQTGDLEERILRKWRQESPANEELYQRTADVWRRTPSRRPVGPAPERPSLGTIVQQAEVRRAGHSPTSTEEKRRIAGRRWLPGVGILALAATAAFLSFFATPEPTPSSDPVSAVPLAAAEFTTGSDQTVTVSLNDGSYVRLAPRSRLRVEPGEHTREVFLEGRGYFAVAGDPDRPFTVHTRLGDALVLGTRFELNVQDDNLRLVVTEGHVALTAGGRRIEVQEGDVIHLAAEGVPVVEYVDDILEVLDWPGGLLVFQATPLRQVARDLTAHFGIPVQIEDDGVATRTVSGSFDDESLEEVLSAICRATATRCVRDDDRVIIDAGDQQ
ncbi:MAG: DUF4974 domain-containing protein [Gemmatimonadales bacterium]|nr:MAG: DUF4974 domain-containing protein [Gemmatimonadales bacterium]